MVHCVYMLGLIYAHNSEREREFSFAKNLSEFI